MAVFVSGRAAKSSIPPILANFSDNSWATIIDACQTNTVPSTWVIGDQKAMTINGAEYMVDIIGSNHDSYSDGTGKAPLTFQLHDSYRTTYAMNRPATNVGGWTDSQIRNTHLPAILALMPSGVQSAIREVNKLTTAGNNSTTIVTTADKLFLLSEYEVFGATSYAQSVEGTRYPYYTNGGSSAKKVGTSTNFHYLRSPASGTTSYCAINSSGGAGSYVSSNTSGLSFAFCF